MQRMLRRTWAAGIGAAAALLSFGAALANVPITKIIEDTFTNATSQHATAVEPDTFADGATNTIVATSQVGRFFDGGASNTGFATSTDGGATWTSGSLPGITTFAGGPYDRASDPVVAYDAEHDVWMISSLGINESGGGITVPNVVVNRSTDGGITWGNPVLIPSPAGGDVDKNWTACDNHPASPFYGNCYTTFDDFADGDRLYVSTSTDGGLTWGAPKRTANNATGLGGQPVVQPNGTVIIPALNAFGTRVIAFRSINGGTSWSRTRRVANVMAHDPAGNLRSLSLPSAEIDAGGKVYLVWHDCRFRSGCPGNDIVLSTSTNGTSWTSPARVPIGTTTDGSDHFIPGIAVDPATSGAGAKLGLTLYSYDTAACGSSCQLTVDYIQSNNGGSTWSGTVDIAGPFPVSWVANTSQGRMVGDYISTSWLGGKAFGSIAVATKAPTPFDEAIYVPTGGVTAGGPFSNSSKGEKAAANAAFDHAGSRSAIRRR